MFNNHNQQQKSLKEKFQEGTNVLFLISSAWVAAVSPILRTRFGRNYPGIFGGLAFVLILLYGPMTQCPEMLDYFWIWLVALVIQRARMVQAHKKGDIVHSRWQGDCWLAMQLPWCKKDRGTQRGVEVAICVGAGAALLEVSQPLGAFFIIAGLAILIVELIERERIRTITTGMRDGRLEMEMYAQRARGQWEDF